MDRDTFHETRLLQAWSNLALNTSKDGESTTSLGNLFLSLTVLTGKDFFLISNLNLSCLSLKQFPFFVSLQVPVKVPPQLSPGPL